MWDSSSNYDFYVMIKIYQRIFPLFVRKWASNTSQPRFKNSKFCSIYPRYKTPCAFKKYLPAVPGRSRGSSALGNVQAVSLYGPMRSSPVIKSSQSESRVCAHVWKSACLRRLFVSQQHKQETVPFLKLKHIIQDSSCRWITVSERFEWIPLCLFCT